MRRPRQISRMSSEGQLIAQAQQVSSNPDEGLLRNAIWHALSTRHARFAEGDGLAKRYLPDVSPLAATRDPSPASLQSLASLLRGAPAALVLDSPVDLPQGWNLLLGKQLYQMVWRGEDFGALAKPDPQIRMELLSSGDAPEMMALVELTQPGPFGPRTVEMGKYIGLRHSGRLVAMAGERLRLPGFTEVSAVCTHPDYRGRGYAAALMSVLVREITARAETPFLHVAAENAGAIRLYGQLGFQISNTVNLAVIRQGSAAS